MKLEKLVLYVLLALLTLVCIRFPVWGVITLERKLDVYPVVSRDTITTIDEMSGTLADFDKACEWHQAAERNLNYLNPGFITATGLDVEEATSAMYAAVDRRKALAAQADFSLLESMMLGTQAYTHSTWMCAPAYANFSTQVVIGLTPTYDVPASFDAQPG